MGAALAAGETPPWMQGRPAPRPAPDGPSAVLAARSGPVLLCGWPVVVDRPYRIEDLAERAAADVPQIAARLGVRTAGDVRFDLIDDLAGIEGWEDWPGWLLLATCANVKPC